MCTCRWVSFWDIQNTMIRLVVYTLYVVKDVFQGIADGYGNKLFQLDGKHEFFFPLTIIYLSDNGG